MAIVFTLCAAYVAYCLGTNPAGPFTTPDSIRYLEAWPMYSLGYPIFLKIVGARGAIVAQPILFGAALAFLGRELVRVTRSTWLAVAVVIATMALPQIREFHASILSESLFLSLLITFLALAVRFSSFSTWHLMVLGERRRSRRTVRRTGFRARAGDADHGVDERHRLRGSQPGLVFVAALAPFLVIIGAEQAAPLVHAGQSSSLMGRHMFAKAALIDAPPRRPVERSGAGRASIEHLQNRLRADSRVPPRRRARSSRRAGDVLRNVPAGRLRGSIAGA